MKVNLENTIQSLSNYLRQYVHQIPACYDWPFDESKASVTAGINFDDNSNWLEKSKALKMALKDKIFMATTIEEKQAVANYYVKSWGRVNIGDEKLNGLVQVLSDKEDQLEENLEALGMDNVSSWSKYLSLVFDWAPIYDSRVAYSINAINYLGGNTDLFFRIPEGRSSRLALLDIKTLFVQQKLKDGSINLNDFEHRQFPSRLQKSYWTNNRNTYSLYVKLIHAVAKELEVNIDDIEMLLFSLAPNQILKDLLDLHTTK